MTNHNFIKIRALVIIFLFIGLSNAICQDLENGLILYYPFSGNFNDAGNNHFNGSGNAALCQDPFGIPERAAHFNGQNQYIDFPLDPILKPDLPLSFSFWIRFELPSPFVTLIFTTDYAQDKHTGAWVSTTNSGTLNCGFGDGTGNSPANRRSFESHMVMESLKWYYVTAVIRGAKDMDLYVDCQKLDGNYAGSGGDMVYTGNPGSLGRKDTGPNNPVMYFLGSLDEFRYYDRALTLEEIDSLCILNDTVINPPDPEPEPEPEPEPGDCRLLLYPNPAQDLIHIACLPEEVTRIEMIDVVGKIHRSFGHIDQIPITDLPPDVYFLIFKDDNQNVIKRKKFVKYYYF